jgi:hypothetical protein
MRDGPFAGTWPQPDLRFAELPGLSRYHALMAGDFAQIVRPHLEELLGPGEPLVGVVAATQQKTFSGGLYALGVTEQRILVVALDRRSRPKGEVKSVTADTLVSADLDGAGGGWWTAPSAILDATAVTLTLRTTDGEKFKLMMMNGSGALGGLGGGEAQRDGVLALAAWMQRNLDAP